MIQPQYNGQLGFSITSPFKAVAHAASAVGHGVATGVKATGSGVATAGKAVGHGAVVGVKAAGHGALAVGKLALKPAEWLVHAAMTPVRNKVHTLRDRRANKIAWDKRKSRTPNAAEKAEAANWTKSTLKSQGPHGQVLALFAGSPVRILSDYESAVHFGDPATASLVTASIPVFLALMSSILGKKDKSGEAPANVGPGGQAMQAKPDAPGTVDVTPVQEAAQAAAEDAAADADSGAGSGKGAHGGGGGGAMVTLPGVGAVKKQYVMIGGAALGGLVLLMLLTRRKA